MNNRIDLCKLRLRIGEKFEVAVVDSKPAGSFIQVMKSAGNQVITGDVIKGITIFDVRERNNNAELIEGPSSPHSNLYINDILVLSPNRYCVVDKDGNVIVFERALKPTNELATFKLQVTAQFNFGE